MNWKARANVFPTLGTMPALLLNHYETRPLPVAAAVRLDTANPVRRAFTAFMNPPVFASAFRRAEQALVGALPKNPRLDAEFLPTLEASAKDTINSVMGGLSLLKRTGVRLRRWPNSVHMSNLVAPLTSPRTVYASPGFHVPLWYIELGAAYFACSMRPRLFRAHETLHPVARIIPQFMGAGTTALVAKRLNRRYLGCDLNAAYVEMARARVDSIPYTLFSLMEATGD